MDSEVLREACAVAEMDVINLQRSWFVRVGLYGFYPSNVEHRAWIESRCADILVGKVREEDLAMQMEYFILAHGGPDGVIADADASLRITAAMAVLKGDG